MSDDDLFAGAANWLLDSVRAALLARELPGGLVQSLVDLLQVAEGALLVVLMTGIAAVLNPPDRAPPGTGRRGTTAMGLAATVAAALLYWLIRSPSPNIFIHLGRLDHLVFSALAGALLSRFPPLWRNTVLAVLSACFLLPHTGAYAFAMVIGGATAGFFVLRIRPLSPRATILVQGTLLAVLLAACWHTRQQNVLEGLRMQGLFAFVLLRHISFVVETSRGRPGRLNEYLCYMLFYPSCIGASEIYSEFHDRNLSRPGRYDYPRAARKIIIGGLQIWAAKQVVMSYDVAISSATFPTAWANILLLFVRGSLYIMGLWATIEGIALLYGFELRPNFARILTRQNPAEFWHAWRATMTNWLIHYVYIPLGGNRHHQTRNICAAFAVSTAWHWMGVPFLFASVPGMAFVPVGLWGAVNALAVAGYVFWRRNGRPILPAGMPEWIRRCGKIFFTVCFGTFTVSLLGFQTETIHLFPAFLRTILGLTAG